MRGIRISQQLTPRDAGVEGRGGDESAEANEQIPNVHESEVTDMYQIYSLVGIVVLLWGITIWASIPEEQEDRR